MNWLVAPFELETLSHGDPECWLVCTLCFFRCYGRSDPDNECD